MGKLALGLQLGYWGALAPGNAHVELAQVILDESGYTAMWQNDKTPEAPGRLENLKELVKALEQFENLQGFLEHVSLVMDNEDRSDEDAVNVMTLHSAKGLEFNDVFLVGMEEELLPHRSSIEEDTIEPGHGTDPVAIDRSGSMVSSGYVDVTRTAAKGFIDLLQIDAFSDRPLGGNPCAVVLDAAALDDAIAALSQLPPLVTSWEIESLRRQLAEATDRVRRTRSGHRAIVHRITAAGRLELDRVIAATRADE